MLALLVGVLLAFCALIALPLISFVTWRGMGAQRLGVKRGPNILWLVHGWIFMIYVVVAFLLARRAGWTPLFTVLMLVAGLVPLLIFWVERQVVERVRAQTPELA